MRMRRLLGRLPALLGAAVIALGASQIMWNGTIGRLAPRLHWHVKIPLGAMPDNPPPLALVTLLDGAWQRSAAHSIGPLTILYRMSVRWRSQIYYSVFGTSGGQEIGVGPQGELFQWAYVRAFCDAGLEAMRAQSPEAANRLRLLQDRLAAGGQEFLYLITPSKVAENPWIIPRGYPCPRGVDAAARRQVWTAALARAGVHHVDATAALEQARGRTPIPLFPRGGTHWDALGAAIGAQALTRAADALGGRLTPFTFDVTVGWQPQGDDRDLYDTLNLPIRNDRYPVPVLAYHSVPPVPCRPQRIAQVAGSFIFQLNVALEAAACPPELRLYWYWDRRAFRYPGGQRQRVPVDPGARDVDILHWADLVILEENEATTPASTHGAALMRLLAARVSAAR